MNGLSKAVVATHRGRNECVIPTVSQLDEVGETGIGDEDGNWKNMESSP